jgi:hypothetical protein
MLVPALSFFAVLQTLESSPSQLGGLGGPNITAAQPSGDRSKAEQLLPGTKRCPDGSILRTIDRCVEMPDHRFEFTHEPARQVQTRRWWCRKSPKASEVAVTIELRQPAKPSGSPTQMSRLDALVVEGRPASASLKKSVQQEIDRFHRFDAFGGRCLFVRSGGIAPVLTLHGVEMDGGKLKWRHQEIPLR